MSRAYMKALNIIFSIVFLFHFLNMAYETLNPSLPVIEVYKKDLSQLEFPIVFKLCMTDVDQVRANTRYEDVGYEDVDDFFLGESKYNETIYGWSGFTEYNEPLGSVEGIVIELFGSILKHYFRNVE